MQFLSKPGVYSLRHSTLDPEISEVAHAFIKQVCHKEKASAHALRKKLRDSRLSSSGTERQADAYQKSHSRCFFFQAAVMQNSIHSQLSLSSRTEGGCKQKVNMHRCEHESGMKNTQLIK